VLERIASKSDGDSYFFVFSPFYGQFTKSFSKVISDEFSPS